MKRYLSLTIFVLIIVTVITAYYIKQHQPDTTLPRFEIMKVSGDEKYIEHTHILGDMYSNYSDVNNFEINKDKTIYQNERPYFKQKEYDYLAGENRENFARWKKDYRSFMRGEKYRRSYFENDDVLVYVGEEYDVFGDIIGIGIEHFAVGVYQKDIDKMHRFKLAIPESSSQTHNEIIDVIYEDGQVKVINLQTNYESDARGLDENHETSKIYQYSFDVERKQMVEEQLLTETVLSYADTDYAYVDVQMQSNAGRNLLITHYHETYSDEQGRQTSVKSVGLFDIAKQKLVKLDLPKKLVADDIISFDEDNLYYLKFEKDTLLVGKYNMKTKELKEIDTVFNQQFDEALRVHHFVDDLLYIALSPSSQTGKGDLVVVDTKALKTVYSGEITLNPQEGFMMEMPEVDFGEIYQEN